MRRVVEVMKSPVVTARPDDSLTHLMNLAKDHQVKHFPIVQDGEVVGIVTDRDLRSATTHPAIYNLLLDLLASLDGGTAEQIMVKEVITVAPETSLEEAAKVMRSRAISCLPVVGGGRLVGILTLSDLVSAAFDGHAD